MDATLTKILASHAAYLRGEPDGQRANLRSANLSDANLSGANLRGADLSGAKFSNTTIIETGETWAVYLADVVPALLTAGGKSLSDIVASGAWDCHSWTNCPMATAFSTHDLTGVPKLLRPRADQFIRYFDAKLIPVPTVTP